MPELDGELLQIADCMDRLVEQSRKDEVKKPLEKLSQAASEIGKAWSGSWLGYHADVYYEDLQPSPPGSHFSQEWGLMEVFGHGSSGKWVESDSEYIKSVVWKRAGNPDLRPLHRFHDEAVLEFDSQKANVVSVLETRESISPDRFLKRLIEEIDGLSIKTERDVIDFLRPGGQVVTRDTLAIGQGSRIPPHFSVLSEVLAIQHTFGVVAILARIARRAGSHIRRQRRQLYRAETIGTNVFIGHGRSQAWRELKDFVEDRLNLPVDEFNRVPVAGVTNIARLSEMMDAVVIALLVMTGEDVQPDGNLRARMNVVHEAGLFQGRLGFTRAIVLLEEGCEEFSNIAGLGQIRFPKGDIRSAFEDVREVLEREGVLSTGNQGDLATILEGN